MLDWPPSPKVRIILLHLWIIFDVLSEVLPCIDQLERKKIAALILLVYLGTFLSI